MKVYNSFSLQKGRFLERCPKYEMLIEAYINNNKRERINKRERELRNVIKSIKNIEYIIKLCKITTEG